MLRKLHHGPEKSRFACASLLHGPACCNGYSEAAGGVMDRAAAAATSAGVLLCDRDHHRHPRVAGTVRASPPGVIILWLDNNHGGDDFMIHLWMVSAGAATAAPKQPWPQKGTAAAAARVVAWEVEESCIQRLCEAGRVADAVAALERVVQLVQGEQVVQVGQEQQQVQLAQEQQQQQPTKRINNNLFFRVLKACSSSSSNARVDLGRRVEALAARTGLAGDSFLATHLIGLYASSGRLDDAARAFDAVPSPSAHNWAAVILAHARAGDPKRAVALYRAMTTAPSLSSARPDDYVFVAALGACGAARDLPAGRQVHAHMDSAAATGPFVRTALFDMYLKCGSVTDARAVFDALPPPRAVVTWNAMASGYVRHGHPAAALALYDDEEEDDEREQRQQQQQLNGVTFLCLLQAAAALGVRGLAHGKRLHAHVARLGLVDGDGGDAGSSSVAGSLVHMYAKCGSVGDAQRVFDGLPGAAKSVVTWTALMAGYTSQGQPRAALRLYRQMPASTTPPDAVTFLCLLQACASVGVPALPDGRRLHAHIQACGGAVSSSTAPRLGASLITMYAKCGALPAARAVFDALPPPARDRVTWNAMLSGYAQHGAAEPLLRLHAACPHPPDACTLLCLVQAAGTAGDLALATALHARAARMRLAGTLAAAVITAYARCGALPAACAAFEALAPSERTRAAWGALVTAYALHGRAGAAVRALEDMARGGAPGTAPDAAAVLSALAACARSAGAAGAGAAVFRRARAGGYGPDAARGIGPDHWACLVDVVGKAKGANRAVAVTRGWVPPGPARAAAWRAVLGACQKWGDVTVAEEAFAEVVKSDERDEAAYVVMANVYARAGMWEQAEAVQVRRKRVGAWKLPGHSSLLASWDSAAAAGGSEVGGGEGDGDVGEHHYPQQQHQLLSFLSPAHLVR